MLDLMALATYAAESTLASRTIRESDPAHWYLLHVEFNEPIVNHGIMIAESV